MKSQKFWVALFVVIPLVLAVGAWISARRGPAFGAEWQPVKIASFNAKRMPDASLGTIGVGRDYVVSESYIYNLKTNSGRSWRRGGLTSEGTAVWEIIDNPKGNPLLEVRDDAGTARYDLPDSYEFDMTLSGWSGAGVDTRDGEIGLVTDRNFYRWKKHRPAPLKVVNFSRTGDGRASLSRDWSRVTCANHYAILIHSASDGRRLQRIDSELFENADYLNLISYGDTALYSDPEQTVPGKTFHLNVLDARNARVLWDFDLENDADHPAFDTESNLIALPLPSRGLWQLRRLDNGAPLRTLPLVEGTGAASFSPDGALLYSLANGVLYRQRAR